MTLGAVATGPHALEGVVQLAPQLSQLGGQAALLRGGLSAIGLSCKTSSQRGEFISSGPRVAQAVNEMSR